MDPAHVAEAFRSMGQGELRCDEPLARHTTLRVGGPADVFIVPGDLGELARIVGFARTRGIPVVILGQGANVIVPDEGVRGIVVSLKRAAAGVSFCGRRVTAGAGCSLSRLVYQAASVGLSGLVGLAGIPGTVGGALYMNAGTHLGFIGDVTDWVRVLEVDGSQRVLSQHEMGFGYRSSVLQDRSWIAVQVGLLLRRGNGEASRQTMRESEERRRRSQPLNLPNAGSIFRNPPGDYAGRLIEAAGCKGWRVGGAVVSPLHANFIVNDAGASAADILSLMKRVRDRVEACFGIRLDPEVRLLGHPSGALDEILEHGPKRGS